MLANNHSMDFGALTGTQSYKSFLENGFATVGFGETIDEAERPLCFDAGDRQVILFNAYWYRQQRHLVSRHYAMGSDAGTACISDSLLKKIETYRKEYSGAYIIFSPHWGVDFTEPKAYQKELAARAIHAGADCIIGHGSHIVSKHERIQGKFVIYSIGNFVFNSNGGQFISTQTPPYAYVAKLRVYRDSTKLRLYPIAVYNPDTFWQPHPVTEEQLNELLQKHPAQTEVVHKDDNGWYLEFDI